MANFDANDIKRQGNRIDEQLEFFKRKATDIVNDLNNISIILKNEDTNLKTVINTLLESYRSVYNSITKDFAAIASVMKTYANKTLQNQEQAEFNAKNIQGKLEQIYSDLQSLKAFGYASDVNDCFVHLDK